MNNVICMRDVEDKLNALSKDKLVESLASIAFLLSFDQDGMLDPEESMAADSAADFVDAVGDVFGELDIYLGDPE